MPTKRKPIRHEMRWRITPAALQCWRGLLELRSGRGYGELSSEERDELHGLHAGLAREVGFCKFAIWPDNVLDEPDFYIRDNPSQLEDWAAGLKIRNALNRALAETAAESAERQAGNAKRSAARGP